MFLLESGIHGRRSTKQSIMSSWHERKVGNLQENNRATLGRQDNNRISVENPSQLQALIRGSQKSGGPGVGPHRSRLRSLGGNFKQFSDKNSSSAHYVHGSSSNMTRGNFSSTMHPSNIYTVT